jgi:hypothetical protein
MAGALGAANGYTDDIAAPAPDAGTDPAAAFAASPTMTSPYGMGYGYSPLMMGLGMGGDPAYAKNLQDISTELSGTPGTDSGPLAQFQALKAERDKAAGDKMAAINRAMGILQASGQRTINAPLLAAGAAMMAPTRTGSIGEALSNAGAAAVPRIEQEREMDRTNAVDLGRLAIAGGEVPMQQEQQDEADFLARQRLAEEYGMHSLYAGARENVAATQATAKVDAAAIMSKGRLDAANVQALKGRIKYIGTDSKDPSTGIYLDTTTGMVQYGPATQGKGTGPSKAVQDAQWLVQNGVAPDLTTAYAMARSGVNDIHQFENEVEHEKSIILSTPQGMQQAAQPGGMEQIENQARENVVARAHAMPARSPQPGAKAPPAAPAAGAAAPAAGAAPAVPPRPASVPPGSAYSPSRGMWRDASGALYDQSGKAIATPAPSGQ